MTTIIYVPGNHDFSMWNHLEQEVRVTRKVRHGEPPEEFRYAIPAIANVEVSGVKSTLFGVDGPYKDHYFDAMWSSLGYMAKAMAAKYLFSDGSRHAIEMLELVQLNYPENVGLSAAMGQSGIMTKLIRKIHDDAQQKKS